MPVPVRQLPFLLRVEVIAGRGRIDTLLNRLFAGDLEVDPTLDLIVRHFAGVEQHVPVLPQCRHRKHTGNSTLARATLSGNGDELSLVESAQSVIQFREQRPEVGHIVQIHLLHVRHFPNGRRLIAFRLFHRCPQCLFAEALQNVVGVLFPQIVFQPRGADLHIGEQLPHLVDQRNAATLAVAEHHHGVKLCHEVPAVLHPCEPSRSVGNADGVGYAGTGKGQAVDLSLGDDQRPALCRIAVIHAEQNGLAFALAPLLRLVPALVVVNEPVLHELHFLVDLSVSVLLSAVEREDQLVFVPWTGGDAI